MLGPCQAGFILACPGRCAVIFRVVSRRKAGLREPIRDTHINADTGQWINFSQIKSSGEIFSEVFVFFRKNSVGSFCRPDNGSVVYGCVFRFSGTGLPGRQFVFVNRTLSTATALASFHQRNGSAFAADQYGVFSILSYFFFGTLSRKNRAAER